MGNNGGVYTLVVADKEAMATVEKARKAKLIIQKSPIKKGHRCPTTNNQVTKKQGVGGKRSPNLIIRDRGLRGGFAQVPSVVLRDGRLSGNAVRLYALLLSYAWQDGECYPGQRRLAADMGVNAKTITRTLRELREKKLIDWHRQGMGKSNIYYIEELGAYLPKQMVDP